MGLSALGLRALPSDRTSTGDSRIPDPSPNPGRVFFGRFLAACLIAEACAARRFGAPTEAAGGPVVGLPKGQHGLMPAACERQGQAMFKVAARILLAVVCLA